VLPVSPDSIYGSLTEPVRDTLSRYRVASRLSAGFDVVLGPLALVTLILVVLEFTVSLGEPWGDVVIYGQLCIWVVFAFAFLVEMAVAPKKLRYLRRNWIVALSLMIPALRVFRVAKAVRILRTARAARSLIVARALAALNRTTRALREFLKFSQLVYLTALSVLVVMLSAAVVFYLERGVVDSPIQSLGDSLWWAAAVITTVNIQQEPVSAEGRVVAILLRLYGVAVIGYFTARLAVFLLGGSAAKDKASTADVTALREEIRGLRQELRLTRTDGEDAAARGPHPGAPGESEVG
jgi:voltage-gated potassium channel